MDNELIYNLIGFTIFAVVAFFILKSTRVEDTNTKDVKRDKIINGYKKELRNALYSLSDDNARIAKKKELLLKISDELSRNIFFEQIEIQEIILDLADNC